MTDLTSRILDGMPPDFPNYKPGTRPIHSKGIAAIGTFRGTPDALHYCRATHFGTGWTPVTVRFSNGNGQMDPDGVPQVRGMAVRFHNGAELDRDKQEIVPSTAGNLDAIELADLICMSVPMFMVTSAADLLGFETALEPQDVHRPGRAERLRAWLNLSPLPPPPPQSVQKSPDKGVLEWAKTYEAGHAFVMANTIISQAQPPSSYARTSFYAVHAFEIEGSDSVRRMVRFSLEPATGVRRLRDPNDIVGQLDNGTGGTGDDHGTAAALDDNYLQVELRKRLDDHAPTRFNLRMQIADPWDDTSDPTVVWPSNRQDVLMGTIELNFVPEDQIAGCEKLGFNPGRLVPGIRISDDPVLRARIDAYNQSQRRRDAQVCPFDVDSSD